MKGIVKTETIQEQYYCEKGRFIVTSKADNSMFFLYEEQDGKAVKISKAKNPNDFKEMVLNG